MTLKERLRAGETVVGCFQSVPSPEVTELCAFAGDGVDVGAFRAGLGLGR